MNIDQLIRDADPAAHMTIPGSDSAIARQSFERVLTARAHRPQVRRRRLAIPVAGGVVAAAVTATTLAAIITPGVPVSPAAAAVLNQAAAAASRQPPVVLKPGEYLYTKTRSYQIMTAVWKPGKVYNPEYVSTDETWLTERGVGREIYTINSVLGFAYGSRRIWIEAGRPKLFTSRRGVSAGDGVPLENLGHLPTAPAALAQAIGQRRTGLASINADIEDPSTRDGTFLAAMEMLSEKSVGGTPALRSALFKVMAELPGIKLIGHATTRSGRSGTGLETPPDRFGNLFKVIIDPAGGKVLETDEYTHRKLDSWTEFLGNGVVKKIGDIPGA